MIVDVDINRGVRGISLFFLFLCSLARERRKNKKKLPSTPNKCKYPEEDDFNDGRWCLTVYVCARTQNTDHRPLTNNTNYKYKDGNQPCS